MNTLLLDVVLWDLVLDVNGNIAVASEPYSLAQDAASAIKTYLGEVFYDTTDGVPYLQLIFGKNPPLQQMKALFEKAALTVPGVASATCYISSVTSRTVTGQIQVIAEDTGQVSAANFTASNPQGA